MSQKNKILKLLGFSQQQTNHTEKLLSLLGGFIGIYAIYLVTSQFFGLAEAIYIIPSMGASAVLLFATPHAPFSQPWNVFGGHIISAIIGVSCYQLIPDIHLAAAASVGFSTGAMYYLRCIHPPGGATALAAVIGSGYIHDLSYMYVITPVLINVITLLIIALLFNAPFKWRRYPPGLTSKPKTVRAYSTISHEDFVYALSQVDSLVDISEEALQEIYALATGRKELRANLKDQIKN